MHDRTHIVKPVRAIKMLGQSRTRILNILYLELKKKDFKKFKTFDTFLGSLPKCTLERLYYQLISQQNKVYE